MIAIALFKLVRFYKLDQMQEINCHFGETIDGTTRDFNYYQEAANRGSPTDQYCLAMMYKKGSGVEKSLQLARHWFKTAGDQGLFLANHELCRLSMFKNWRPIRGSKEEAELESLCCPKFTRSICPWHLSEEEPMDEWDFSSHRNRFF